MQLKGRISKSHAMIEQVFTFMRLILKSFIHNHKTGSENSHK